MTFVFSSDRRLRTHSSSRGVGLSEGTERESADPRFPTVAAWYRRDGWDFPGNLGGAFSLIADLRPEGPVILARDAMGTEPLYYSVVSGVLTAADCLAPLVAASDLDEAYLVRALVGDFSDLGSTPYPSVRRVPPGHTLVWWGGDRTVLHRWWKPPEVDDEFRGAHSSDLAFELRTRLEQAVQRCVARTPIEFAVELTGGLDSSAVAALASAAFGSAGVRAYTFAGDDDGAHLARERPFREAVIATYGLDPTISGADRRTAGDHAPIGPMPHPTMLPFFRLAHLNRANADGVRQLLSGWGGDQLASYDGGGALSALVRSGRVISAVNLMRRQSRYRRMSAKLLARREFDQHVVAHRRAKAAMQVVESMADPGFARRGGLADVRLSLPAASADKNRLRLAFDGHVQRRIECYAWDVSGMPMTYSYPLLDRSVVEFVLRVPAARWVEAGRHRSLFRQAMEPYLPANVVHRPWKNERNPGRAAEVAATRHEQEQRIRELARDPRVAAYLPGLTQERYRQLDNPRRTHVLLVAEFLVQQTWSLQRAS